MRMYRGGLIAWAASMALMAACASGGGNRGAVDAMGGAEPASREGTIIVVRNNRPGAVTVTAYLMPEVGADRTLGSIDPGREVRFPFNGPAGRYRLRLVGAGGETVSDIFRLYESSEATWDLSLGLRVRVANR